MLFHLLAGLTWWLLGCCCCGGVQVFAVGVLLYELAMNKSPWPDYPDDCRSAGGVDIHYDTRKLDQFGPTYPQCACVCAFVCMRVGVCLCVCVCACL